MRYGIMLLFLGISGIYANVINQPSNKKIEITRSIPKIIDVKFQGGFENFKKKFRMMESTNNPDTINGIGMLGLYQFGKGARAECGYSYITTDDFRKNPKIWSTVDQDKAFIRYLKINKKRISKLLKKYDNKVINDVVITESGVLAACHLAGAGNVRRFLENKGNFDFADEYGSTIEKYLKEFGGFKFNLNKI